MPNYHVVLKCKDKGNEEKYGMTLIYNNLNIAETNFFGMVKFHITNPLEIIGSFSIVLLYKDNETTKTIKIYQETME